MKKRTENTKTGNLCVDKVRDYCARFDLIFQAEPREDFGIDCYIELEEQIEGQGYATNFIVGIQCKSGQSYKKNIKENSFDISLNENDKNYWLSANFPVFYVYFDNSNDKLYFKHIQSIFHSEKDIQNIKELNFSNDDLVDEDNLQLILLNLRDQTPNYIDRINLASTKEIIWYVNDKIVQQQEPINPDINELVYIDETCDCSIRYPYLSQLIGYSSSDEWVCILEIQALGQKCGNVNGTLLNLKNWKAKKHSIFTEKDYDYFMETDTRISEEVLLNRLEEFKKDMATLQIEPYHLIHSLTKPVYEEDSDLAQMMFKNIKYSLDIRKNRGIEELTLEANRFHPKRSASLLYRQTNPALCHDGFDTFAEVKYINKIEKIHQSQSGNIITFALITNPENGCWGSNDIHFSHFYKEEILDKCLQSLM
jgi:hypothetical protein